MGTGREGTRRRYDTARFERHELTNGIPVWIQEPVIATDDEGILIGILNGIGAAMDPSDAPGTAHFFEHIPFRGTRGRPTKFDLVRPIYERAGEVDANTSLLRSAYSVLLPHGGLELAAETISEMAFQPLIRAEDVELEIGAVIRERAMLRASGDYVRRVANQTVLFAGHPYARDTIGALETIRSMTAERLVAFHAAHYHAGNLVLVCGGSFAEGSGQIAVLERAFGALPARAPDKLPYQRGLPHGKSGRITLHEPAAGRDGIAVLYGFPPMSRDRFEAYHFLAHALSDGFDAPLFLELRERRGLVYEDGLANTGELPGIQLFMFACGTPRDNFGAVREIFRECLVNLDADYLARRQERRQGARRLAFTHPTGATRDAANEIAVYEQPTSYEEDAARADALTLEEVVAARDALLNTDPFVVEVITS